MRKLERFPDRLLSDAGRLALEMQKNVRKENERHVFFFNDARRLYKWINVFDIVLLSVACMVVSLKLHLLWSVVSSTWTNKAQVFKISIGWYLHVSQSHTRKCYTGQALGPDKVGCDKCLTTLRFDTIITPQEHLWFQEWPKRFQVPVRLQISWRLLQGRYVPSKFELSDLICELLCGFPKIWRRKWAVTAKKTEARSQNLAASNMLRAEGHGALFQNDCKWSL